MYRLPVYTFTAMDIASSEARTADYTVIGTGATDYRNNLMVLEIWKRKGSNPVERMAEATRQVLHYQSRILGMEENRAEDFITMYEYMLKRGEFIEEFGEESRSVVNRIQRIPHYGLQSKRDRIIDRLQPVINSHSLWLPKSLSWFADNIDIYPQVEYDDDIDMLEMLRYIAVPPSQEHNISGYEEESMASVLNYNPITMSWN